MYFVGSCKCVTCVSCKSLQKNINVFCHLFDKKGKKQILDIYKYICLPFLTQQSQWLWLLLHSTPFINFESISNQTRTSLILSLNLSSNSPFTSTIHATSLCVHDRIDLTLEELSMGEDSWTAYPLIIFGVIC